MFCVSVLLVMMVGVVQSQSPSPSAVDCTSAEIGFILDSSASIETTRFDQMKSQIISLANKFQLGTGNDKFRVAINTAGDQVYDSSVLFSDKTSLEHAINTLTFRDSLTTRTDLAIKDMVSILTASTRTKSHKLMVVLTDGDSKNKPLTKQEAVAARSSGIETFVIAVGVQESEETTELNDIAGKSSNVFRINETDQIESAMKSIACYCHVDMIFALDHSRSISSTNWLDIKAAAKDMVDLVDVGQNFDQVRIGILEYGDTLHEDTVLNLTESTDKMVVKNHIDSLSDRVHPLHSNYHTRFDLALVYIRDTMFSLARPNTQKIIVDISDSQHNRNELKTLLPNTKRTGIKIYGLWGECATKKDIHRFTRLRLLPHYSAYWFDAGWNKLVNYVPKAIAAICQ